ncbi:hypothetical protein [Nonomuraea sp. NPDC049480]|uniref:hypothetical protein n=1 Tax=Nonomuraea sp. NPDC049480 TaxID=3364353 RepID=UPI00379C0161
MKGLLPRLGAVFVAAVFATGCSAGEKTIIYEADYPVYESADALFDRATLVVEGRVTGQPRVLQQTEELPEDPQETDPQLNPNAGAPAQAKARTEEPPTVITVYSVEVLKVFKGEAKPGQIVEVKELGGELDGVTYKEVDLVPLRTEQGYTMFLETYPDSPAALLNPQQGKYPLDASGNPQPLAENPVKLTRTDLTRLATGE